MGSTSRTLALGLLLTCTVASVRAAVVHEVEVFIGHTEELEVGLVERVLNLDPEIVRCTAATPDTLLLEGLAWGEATVRVWTVAGEELVLKVRVPGVGPSRPADGLPLDDSGVAVRSSLHLFSYSTPTTDVVVPAAAIEVSGDLLGLRSGVELWMEERNGAVEVPRARVQLGHHGPGGPAWGVVAGSSHVRWSRFTLFDRYLEGLQVEAGTTIAGRPLSLELAWGRPGRDRLPLGSRLRTTVARDDRLGGGRLSLGLTDTTSLVGEVGTRREADGGTEANAVLAAVHSGPRLDLAGEVAHDGERWSGAFSGRFASKTTSLSLRGESVADGFTDLRGRTGLRGIRSLAAGFQHRHARWTIGLDGSWLDLDPRAFPTADGPTLWPRTVRASGRAAARLGEATAVESRLQWREQGLGATLWQSNEAWLVLRHAAHLAGTVGIDMEGTVGTQRHQLSGREDGEWGWDAARLDVGLRAGAWLRAGAAVTRRFSFTGDGEPPGDLLWSAVLSARAGAHGPLAEAELRARLLSWDHLVATAGRFSAGRHLSAQGSLRTRWWRGVALEGRASWSRDLESGDDSLATEISMHLRLGRRHRRDRPGRPGTPTSVRGLVFTDHNGNGLRDAGEEGLAGVAVRLADGEEALTDGRGRFRFARVPRDAAEVRVVQAALPDGLEPTTAPYQSGAWVEFGLGPAPGAVEVLAFNDLDGDGERDADEPLVAGVGADLGEALGVLTTSREGASWRTIPAGSTTVVRWRTAALPEGFRPTPAAEMEARVLVAAGDTVAVHLPLVASRSVRGVVFEDSDADGARDHGEKTVAGVELTAGDRFAVTGKDGAFTLKGLPHGPLVVRILPRSLDQGWRAPTALELDLPAEPVTLTGVEIGLTPGPSD